MCGLMLAAESVADAGAGESSAKPRRRDAVRLAPSASALIVDHEVGVPLAHDGATAASPLEADLVDEAARRGSGRVLEESRFAIATGSIASAGVNPNTHP